MPEQPEVTAVEVDGRRLRLTSLSKVMYPESETTKGEVLAYYASVAPLLLAQMRGRPVTRVRWPHGVAGDSFFEKNLPSGAPSWLPSVAVGDVTYPLVESLADLTFLANLNSLEFHVPQWRVGPDRAPANPDRLVIDLDPGSPAGLPECARVAVLVRERLAALGMALVPVTSGSKGMQLYGRLGGDLDSDQVRTLVEELAKELTAAHPELVVWKMTRSLRAGKVFLDWSQNVAAKTTIAPYSMRGRAIPNVAAPRLWDEVEAGAAGRPFEQIMFEDMAPRLAKHGDLAAALN